MERLQRIVTLQFSAVENLKMLGKMDEILSYQLIPPAPMSNSDYRNGLMHGALIAVVTIYANVALSIIVGSMLFPQLP